MSMAALRWARSVRGVTGTQKLVLWALADMANDYAEAWPSATALAEDCCLSDRAVRDAMDALETGGLITGQRAHGRATRWVLNLSQQAATQMPPTPAPRSAPPERRSDTPEPRSAHQERASTMEPYSATQEPASGVSVRDPGAIFRGAPERGSYPPRNVVPDTPERGSDITLNNPHRTLTEPSQRERASEHFADFWQAYPRKVGKGAAEKAFATAISKGATVAEIASGLNRQQWPTEPRFIPHPATWLNQRRWMDDPTAAAPKAPEREGKLDWLWREMRDDAPDGFPDFGQDSRRFLQ